MTQQYDLPPLPDEFQSGNEIPVERATFTRQRMEEVLRDAIEADRQRRGEPVVMREICPECGHQFECFHNGYINELRAAHDVPQPAEPKGCQMGEHACSDPSQCWEPCGELGNSKEHAQMAQPPFCEECGDGIMAHDPGICGTCYSTKYADRTDPVKLSSKNDLLRAIINYADARATITENRMAGIAEVDRERDRLAHDDCAQAYADMTALLARYGSK